MSIFLLLIPLMFVLGMIGMAAFFWALNSGQLEDLERHGSEVLHDEGEPK